METNNFEQQSREKFEERELQPSNAAWGKLEQMLDEAQPPREKTALPWLAIAASFVGIAIIATVFFSRNSNTENDLVEQDNPSEILKTDNPVIDINNESETKIAENTIEDSEIISEKSNSINKDNSDKIIEKENASAIAGAKEKTVNKLNTKAPVVKDNQIKASIVKNEKTFLNKNNNSTNSEINTDAIATVKTTAQKDQLLKISEEKNESNLQLDAVVAQVKELKNTKNVVTEADIDALLLNAQKKLQTNRILSNTKVDAMALLGDVEMEINLSFRDRVFYALEEGFDYVKTTIVTRND